MAEKISRPNKIIIQARMSSQRLPGKVLTEVRGKPLLAYLLERLKASRKFQGPVVITSSDRSDDPIRDYCRKNDVPVFSGPLENVASRFFQVLQKDNIQTFARISGDSPLIDPALIDQGMELFETGRYDIVTNVLKRTYPKGTSFEIMGGDFFCRHFPEITDAEDQEHVTPFFYRNASRFKTHNLANPNEADARVNFCVDTPQDLKTFSAVLNLMNRPFTDYRWDELLPLYRQAQA